MSNRPLLRPVICSPPYRIYIAQNLTGFLDDIFHCFSADRLLEFEPVGHEFGPTFGPFRLNYLLRFISILEAQIADHPGKKIVYYVEPGQLKLANAAFLLGAYMILRRDASAEKVSTNFRWLCNSVVTPFQSANLDNLYTSDLSMMHCWNAIERAKALGWFQPPRVAGGPWGKIDLDEYEYYNDPINADLHQVVPGKLVAFKAPKDLHGLDYCDDAGGGRHFSPAYFIDIFQEMGVSDVVSADPPAYDRRDFTRRGVRHHELDYGDLAAPSLVAVEAFFQAVDRARGAVAVHSAGGHGRNGTLVALYLMRRHGFGAREAIAWVRMCRPGSVLGEQHRFLCRLEAAAAVLSKSPSTTRTEFISDPDAASSEDRCLPSAFGGRDVPVARAAPAVARAAPDTHARHVSAPPPPPPPRPVRCRAPNRALSM